MLGSPFGNTNFSIGYREVLAPNFVYLHQDARERCLVSGVLKPKLNTHANNHDLAQNPR